MPPAYPNISPTLGITDGGKTVLMSGPLTHDDVDVADVESIHVFALVAQQPPAGTSTPLDDEQPPSSTARGESTVFPEERNWRVSAAAPHGDTFTPGWAFATAVAVKLSKSGPMSTYSWSRWVGLVEHQDPAPRVTDP